MKVKEIKKLHFATVLVITTFVILPSAAWANLIVDGGFNTPDFNATAWTSCSLGISWTQEVEKTEGTHGLGQINDRIWQDFEAIPETTYLIQAYCKTAADFPMFRETRLGVDWFDINNDIIGSNCDRVVGPIPYWIHRSLIDTTPLNTVKGRLWIETMGGGTAYWDDVSVTVVPEPSTILLVTIGLVGFFGLRRRLKK